MRARTQCRFLIRVPQKPKENLKGYPRLTRADTLSGGPDGRWTSSSSSVGVSPPSSSSSPEPIIARRKVLRSFSGAETMVSEADEAAGLSPGNEENEADRCFSPEKPCLPLSIEGTEKRKNIIFILTGGESCGNIENTCEWGFLFAHFFALDARRASLDGAGRQSASPAHWRTPI